MTPPGKGWVSVRTTADSSGRAKAVTAFAGVRTRKSRPLREWALCGDAASHIDPVSSSYPSFMPGVAGSGAKDVSCLLHRNIAADRRKRKYIRSYSGSESSVAAPANGSYGRRGCAAPGLADAASAARHAINQTSAKRDPGACTGIAQSTYEDMRLDSILPCALPPAPLFHPIMRRASRVTSAIRSVMLC